VSARWGKPGLAAGVAAAAALLTSCINFAPAVPSQASTIESARSIDVVFGDVTGDGSEDVIVAIALPGADALVRMAPCGAGCLERREEVPVGGDVSQVAAADFDGDDVTDIAVVTAVDARVYFGGRARGQRPEGLAADDFVVAAEPEFEPWGGIVAGDFDDDGDADIALTSRQLYDYVAGDGNRRFSPPVQVVLLPARASISGLAAGDIDGDGDPEVLVSESGLGTTNVLGVVVAFRDGVSQVGSYTENGLLFGGLSSDDIDGDGKDDVALTRFVPAPIDFRDVRLLRSTGTGFTGFGPGGAVTSLSARLGTPQLRDIDLDGKVDLLASDGTRLSWWHGQGNGNFAVRVDRDAGPSPGALAFSDGGGSPGPDLVVANSAAPFAQVSYLTNSSQL
jgi:FG-GAP-like repeat